MTVNRNVGHIIADSVPLRNSSLKLNINNKKKKN